MARIVSPILQLDELTPPPAPPVLSPETPAVKPLNLPLLLGGLAVAGLCFFLWMPLGVLVVVGVGVWQVLLPAISPGPTPARPRRPGLGELSRRAHALAPDEAGHIGVDGEMETLWRLLRLPEEYVILYNLEVPTARGTTQADLVVVAPDAVWCLEVKAWAGRVYGQEAERHWTQVKLYGNQVVKDRRRNPVQQNAYHCEAVRAYLSGLGFRAPVRSLVVFTRAELKTEVATGLAKVGWLPAVLSGAELERVLTAEEVGEVATVLAGLTAEVPVLEVELEPEPAADTAAASVPAVAPQWATTTRQSPLRRMAVRLLIAVAGGAVCALLLLLVVPLMLGGMLSALAHATGAPAGAVKLNLSSANFLPVAALFGLAFALRVLLPEKRRRRARRS